MFVFGALELFWSVFSRIRTRITPNTDTFHTVVNSFKPQNTSQALITSSGIYSNKQIELQKDHIQLIKYVHCVKSVRIRGYSGPHFPAFGLNVERYGVSLRIQSDCGKM